jgi:hypothetical protein
MLQWYAQTTGNTGPLNHYLKTLGKAIEQDVDGWLMEPINQQGPSPEQIEQMEMEKAKRIAEITGRQLKNTDMAHKLMEQGAGLPMESMGNVMPEFEDSSADAPAFYNPPV